MGIALRHFLLFKLAFAAAEGAMITPLIAALGISLTDVTQRKRDRPSTAEVTDDAEAISIRRSIELRPQNLDLWMVSAQERDLGVEG